VVVSLPNNSILPSLSTICAYPLLQVAPATAAAARSAIQSLWQASAFHTAPPFTTISFLFFLAHTQSRNLLLSAQPTSTRAHPSSTSPHGTAGCPGPCTRPSCTACVARRGPPARVGAPLRPARTRILRRSQDTQHHADPPTPQSVGCPDDPTTYADGTYADVRLPSDGWNAARATAVRVSFSITIARQRGTTLGGPHHRPRRRRPRRSQTRRARSTAVGWEMRMIYFVDHSTRTATWDDLRLPSTVDADAPQNKCNYRWKVVNSQNQPPNRRPQVRRAGAPRWVFENTFAAIIRFWPEDLRKPSWPISRARTHSIIGPWSGPGALMRVSSRLGTRCDLCVESFHMLSSALCVRTLGYSPQAHS
jgi:hypothetical protein